VWASEAMTPRRKIKPNDDESGLGENSTILQNIGGHLGFSTITFFPKG